MLAQLHILTPFHMVPTATVFYTENNFSDRFSVRTQISSSDIKSSDLMDNSPEYRKLRGKSFENTVQELSLIHI